MHIVVIVAIFGLMLVVEPSLHALAGYLLVHDGYRTIGTAVLLVNAVVVAAVLFEFLPKCLPRRLHPLGKVLAELIVRDNVNIWVGLIALGYSAAVREWLPALVLTAGGLVAIGRLGLAAWLSDHRL